MGHISPISPVQLTTTNNWYITFHTFEGLFTCLFLCLFLHMIIKQILMYFPLRYLWRVPNASFAFFSPVEVITLNFVLVNALTSFTFEFCHTHRHTYIFSLNINESPSVLLWESTFSDSTVWPNEKFFSLVLTILFYSMNPSVYLSASWSITVLSTSLCIIQSYLSLLTTVSLAQPPAPLPCLLETPL